MEEEWTIKLTRDEGLVLFDFLQRWEETNADLGFVDSAEQAAIVVSSVNRQRVNPCSIEKEIGELPM